MTEQKVPESPEEYPADVRAELGQHDVTHEGVAREDDGNDGEAMGSHMGAVDTEPTPVTPPMRGPDELIEGVDAQAGIDPADEIPGG